MKIIVVIDHMTIGGAQRVAYNLIKWLQKNTSAEVQLLLYRPLVVGNVKYDLGEIKHLYLNKGTLNRVLHLRRVLKDVKPDVLVSMGTTNAIFDVPAILGLGIKHIISERNDPAHFGGSMVTRILSHTLMRMADGYVFQTKDAQSFYGGRIAKRSVIIPNPLFVGGDYPNEQYRNERKKIIVSVGRLNKQKNHPLLIRAFKNISEEFPDYKLMIYGDGPERGRDEFLIEQLGLQGRVLLPGTIKNIPEKIYEAAMFVLSSDFEGMPNALIEAMALGLPCISTDCPCGGPRELTTNEQDCLLVPVGDENALANAMRRILKNPDVAQLMGKKAMDIREKLSVDKICRLWYNYFVDINAK
ncbi:MAG: glycosyltransferase family 4 protein [Prevotella sp.]|nr:glycosyltransferase family 4 protein [Prevotella sp.]